MQLLVPCPDLASAVPGLNSLLSALSMRNWNHYYFNFEAEFTTPETLSLTKITYRNTGRADTQLVLRLTPDSLETNISKITPSQETAFTHLLTDKTLRTPQTRAFLEDSVLSRLLEDALGIVEKSYIKNAVSGLDVNESPLVKPLNFYVPLTADKQIAPLRPEVASRLDWKNHRYRVEGGQLRLQATTPRLGFLTQAHAHKHASKLYLLDSTSPALARYRLGTRLGVFFVTWPAHRDQPVLTSGLQRMFGEHTPGYLVTLRPLSLYESDHGEL